MKEQGQQEDTHQIAFEDGLQLTHSIKVEPLSHTDSSEDCLSDGSEPVNYDSSAEATPSGATQAYREKLDEANLRTWSPGGLFPKLSSLVQPLLRGAPMHPDRHKALSGKLRDEIIQFLNEHRLIEGKNTSANRWAYCALGRSLATRYPCMVWERPKPGTKVYSRNMNRWTVFIHRLSVCRKTQKWRMMRKRQDASTAPATTVAPTTLATPTTPATPTRPSSTTSASLAGSIKQE